MESHISFDSDINDEDSYQLTKLASMLEDEYALSVELERLQAAQGERDGGLVIGIAIASLGFTAIQALIAALQYWDSRQPKYSVSVISGNKTLLVENLTQKAN
ncbi:MAG: hypothetical protein F6K00_26830 [Leptolyngbya sp. SIOISBB]|nr:hypothetical protein [Leptolyngbya sp. SIOISBB]